jgi:hypothetical protein
MEPLRVKTQAINSAAEAAVMILRIDDVIASKSGGAGGMPGGMPGGMLVEWVERTSIESLIPFSFLFRWGDLQIYIPSRYRRTYIFV